MSETTSPMDPALFTQRHVLYRLYDRYGRLIYIGITNNLCQRFQHHKYNSDWWGTAANATFQFFQDRTQLACAERDAIRTEHPIHNRFHRVPDPVVSPVLVRTRGGIRCTDDEWDWIHGIGPYAQEAS